MNSTKKITKSIIFTLILGLSLFFPSLASACSMSGIGHLFPLIAGGIGLLLLAIVIVVILVLLVLYLLYVFFSIRLARQAASPEGTTKFTRVVATFFAVINTLLFFVLSAFNGWQDLSYFYFDLAMWGIPFYYYIKGMKSSPPTTESLTSV